MTTYQYPVRREFTYKGKVYEPGDMWTPAGEKNDQNIIKYFTPGFDSAKIKQTRKRGKKKASNGN